METIEINGKMIGKTGDPFIVAEAGINHNGNLDLAKKMVLAAKEAGADAIKFQTFHAEEFIQDKTTTYTYKSQGKEVTESMLEMFKRCEFTENEWADIKAFCDKQNITFLSTPQNFTDLGLLIRIGIPAIKIGSDDFVNIPLVRKYADVGLPMMLSCGMANEDEITKTLHEVKNNPTILFLCTSQYPTPPKDVNILKLVTLQKKYPRLIVGLSDHTRGLTAACMAVALGAKIFEKHFTLDHNLPGPDHWFSETPEELKYWVNGIHEACSMLGSPELKPTEAEWNQRMEFHRSITTAEKIKKGDFFTENNLCMRRPGSGLPGSKWDLVIGKRALRNIEKNEQIKLDDVDV